MAVDRTPVLKRCRQLDIDPIVMGINKKSNRQPKRQRRQESEYGRQLREKQKAKFIYGVLEVDIEKLQGTVLQLPTRDQIDLDIDAQLIVELYSK